MKKLKFLVLLFLGILAPTISASAETSYSRSYTHINPIYSNIYSENDIKASFEAPRDISPDEYFKTIGEAGLYLRSEYLQGNTSVVVSIESTLDPRIESEYTLLIESIYDKAVEHTGVPNEGDYLANNTAGYKAELIASIGNEKYYYQITYNLLPFTTKAEEDELDAKIKEVLASLNLTGKTEYQKASLIYDYIIKNIVYDYDSYDKEVITGEVVYKAHSAYNALIKKTSVCQGYALLFYRMALEAGLDTRFISGYSEGGPHAWNIVKIGAYYYNVDATWDASYIDWDEKPYFLKSMESFTGHTRDNDYKSAEFNAKYPMSPTDYQAEEVSKGDINSDGKLDLTDVLLVLKNYFNSVPATLCPAADLNNSGTIDLTDILLLIKLYFTAA